MAGQKSLLRINHRSDGYFFTEVRQSYEVYCGRIYCLTNSQSNYALIFDQVIPSEGHGPPGLIQKLLSVGEYPLMGRAEFLQDMTEKVVREQAETLSKEKNLRLEFLQSQPKCTDERQKFPLPHVDPNSPNYNPFKQGGDNPDPRMRC